jgi:hypothetical protein
MAAVTLTPEERLVPSLKTITSEVPRNSTLAIYNRPLSSASGIHPDIHLGGGSFP